MKKMKNSAKWQRYLYALCMITAMVGCAEWLGEQEIIFPEMAALTIGMWIVDKRVWRAGRLKMVGLMTWGALAGILIVRYSPFPLMLDLGLAFSVAACSLLLSRTTLIPLISACMLPVLLHTESWVYPSAVFIMSCIIVAGQYLMEKRKLRHPVAYIPLHHDRKKELTRWILLLCIFWIIAALPVYTHCFFCILPPLVVTYAEFAHSKAGFRNRPVQIFFILTIAATLGTLFQLTGHHYLGLPVYLTVPLLFTCIFLLFEWLGKSFAPAGAMALIPMIVPQENLIWLPLQAAIGAALFISAAMLVFLKCYKWPKAYLIVCLLPGFMRTRRNKSHHRSGPVSRNS